MWLIWYFYWTYTLHDPQKEPVVLQSSFRGSLALGR